MIEKYYRCEKCGQIISVIKDSDSHMECCGIAMQKCGKGEIDAYLENGEAKSCGIGKAVNAMHGWNFWQNLTEQEKAFLLENSSIKRYKKGDNIFCTIDSCLGLLYVVSGSVRVAIASEAGREITLFKICKGETCVLSASCVIQQITFDTIMVAIEDVELLAINASAVKSIMEENLKVRCFVYELATERFSTAMWVLQEILFQGFDKRLASYIVEQGGMSGELSMTQEEIAKDVNSSREVVTRMLKHFINEDMIAVKRGKILIKDLQGLMNIINA